jgi:alkanesulfonate monooxygenase SsuD/methylene tetrahydromethanopterin reductase-like flavin-dependent oxidoreductase (luciferase family)
MIQVGALYMGGCHPAAFASAAEKAGFDSLWVGDHLLGYVEATTVLGCFAACTERVALGTNVIVMPFRRAAVTAKALLTAKWLTGRRTILGAGVGGDVPAELQLAGIDASVRGAYTDEALEVIRTLWVQEGASYSGRWNAFDNVTMQPRLTEPPEIWIGGRSDASIRRAVKHGNGYLPYLISPTQLADRYEKVRKTATLNGKDLSGFTFGATTFMMVGQSHDSVLARVRTGFRNVGPDNIDRYYVLGDTDDCVQRLKEYLAVGVEHLVIGCSANTTHDMESYMTASRELIPELRRFAVEAETAS